MYVSWDESLSVGVADLDSDHRKLLAILDDFFSACYAGQAPETLEEIFGQLIEYAKYHFDKEEALLAGHGYPKLEDHRQEHKRLIGQIERLQNSLQAEASAALTNTTMKFLNSWLIDHIGDSDMGYKLHLNSMGVR